MKIGENALAEEALFAKNKINIPIKTNFESLIYTIYIIIEITMNLIKKFFL
jgi:hypothetical protein